MAETNDKYRAALGAARDGLQWYRDAYPEADSGADDEMMALIEEALASKAAAPAIVLDFKMASELLEMFGGEPGTITLMHGDGHSGNGLYAHYEEYPEEGAEFLGVPNDEAAPPPAAVAAEPICPDCEGTGRDGDCGNDGRTIDIDCGACKGTGNAPSRSQAAIHRQAAVFRSSVRGLVPASAEAATTALLCRIWGEDINHTLTAILPDWDAVCRFCVEFWTGSDDATDYDGSSTLGNLKAEFDEHESDERGGAYTQRWEIGGVSIERICDCTPRAPDASPFAGEPDKLDAARYRWLRDVSVPPHNFYLSVPNEFDGVKYSRTQVDAAIDAAIDSARKLSEGGPA